MGNRCESEAGKQLSVELANEKPNSTPDVAQLNYRVSGRKRVISFIGR